MAQPKQQQQDRIMSVYECSYACECLLVVMPLGRFRWNRIVTNRFADIFFWKKRKKKNWTREIVRKRKKKVLSTAFSYKKIEGNGYHRWVVTVYIHRRTVVMEKFLFFIVCAFTFVSLVYSVRLSITNIFPKSLFYLRTRWTENENRNEEEKATTTTKNKWRKNQRRNEGISTIFN